ncbi:hypothetical protein M1O20_02855 [Dehalococcoidia bacterium]|nr:hypothetical protein [Dehalococcoidia bacterium]
MTIKLEEHNQTRNIDCADFAAEEGKTLLLASRDCKQAGTAVDIGGIKLGLINDGFCIRADRIEVTSQPACRLPLSHHNVPDNCLPGGCRTPTTFAALVRGVL